MALLPGFRKQGQAWTRPVDAALDVADPGLSPAQALHPHSEEFGMRQGKLQVSVRCGIGNRWPATVCSWPHRSVRGPKAKALCRHAVSGRFVLVGRATSCIFCERFKGMLDIDRSHFHAHGIELALDRLQGLNKLFGAAWPITWRRQGRIPD